MRTKSHALMLVFLTSAASTAADACSIISNPYSTVAEHRSRTRASINTAPAIIDGEVVSVGGLGEPSLVYAHRVLKGPAQSWFKVGSGGGDSCELSLRQPGERMRMILSGGPEQYILYRDQSDARMEDSLLGTDRSKDFPYFAGPRVGESDSRTWSSQ